MAIKDELGISLERLHEFIDGATEARDTFQHSEEETIHPGAWWPLCEAIIELDGIYLGPNLVIKAPQKMINAFTRSFEPVDTKEAYILASKVVSFLRSIEGEFSEETIPDSTSQEAKPEPEIEQSGPEVQAVQWIVLPHTSTIKEQITEIAILLDSIIDSARGSNLPESERALSDIERVQLIAILETALKLLKAPMVEKGLLKKSREGLWDVAKKTAQKRTEEGFGRLAEEGAKLLELLIKGLFG